MQDPVKPFVYAFHIRVPGYAQRTGKRLFLQPAFFERGRGALFTSADRKNMVYFNYPWSEQDDVEFELPTGFALDNADAPAPFAAGAICKYDVALAVTKDRRQLVYRRKFFFGGGGNGLLFPATSYPQLKLLFDMLHKSDDHTITLKQGAATETTSKTTSN